MKRRSRASGKAPKARHRKALKPKRRDASKTASSSVPIQDAEVARLTRELNEALEQQTATSEVLQVISSSPGDLEPVFSTMLENAVRICGATFGTIYRRDGDAFRIVTSHKAPAAFVEAFKQYPYISGKRMVATKSPIHVADATTTQSFYTEGRDPKAVAAIELGGVRTFLAVPMLKDGEVIGAFLLNRKEVRPFTDKQIELVKNFAAQAVIAIENARLLNELRQRTTDLTERTADLTEALEQQTTTSEVLQVISSSPGDLEPVFATMLENAVRICDAAFGDIFRWEGDGLRLVTSYNAPPAFAEMLKCSPMLRPGPSGRRMLETQTHIHIADVSADPIYLERKAAHIIAAVELGGIRTLLAVPMLRDTELVGEFILSRQEVRPFTDKQIALVTNFAAQAVIAIENARLLNELRQRTTDLTEALEQQTAASDVLQVISSFPGDLEPVFATMLEKAVRICDASWGHLYRWNGETFGLLATHNTPVAFVEYRRRSPHFVPHQESAFGRIVATKTVVHVADAMLLEGYVERSNSALVAAVELGRIRTFLFVPMLKADELIGIFTIFRQDVRPFTDKQIALVTNFAAQAVIAIENARLLNELRQRTSDLTERTADLTEALDQQTATSEVLQVISSSPGDLEPVFQAMLENATRICEAKFGVVFSFDGNEFHFEAQVGTPPELAEYIRARPMPQPLPGSHLDRLRQTKRVSYTADYAAEGISAPPVTLGGARSTVDVPMLKDNELVGAFSIYRQEVRPFTEKQIELVKNFAAQAVIAIENARLLNELRQRTSDLTEALKQQKATSDLLQVISGFPGNLEPVFQAMLENAVGICGANFGNMFFYEDGAFLTVAMYNAPKAYAKARTSGAFVPPSDSLLGRLVSTKEVAQVADLRAEQRYIDRHPHTVEAVELAGIRTALAVPMLREGHLIGGIVIFRQEVQPFSEKQIELVKNFASQVVIAIGNARLLGELRETTDEVVKLNQQLEQRVADQVGEIERMSRLRRFLPPQVADLIVASGTEKQLESHRREITALFCDLRGFTGFSESADPEDVMTVLREYHEALGASIIKYSGTLERYAGDGVMVVFNDPVPVDNPALQAVLMALEMRDAIGALTEAWRRWGHEIGFGIGIAHGFATLGTIGFEGRFDYAAIGTVSNVASRLCDEAKPGQILISPRVLTKVEDAVKVEPVGEFVLKGIRRPLAAYNVLAAASPEN